MKKIFMVLLITLSSGLATAANIASLGVATADIWEYGGGPERAIDGDNTTEWNAGTYASSTNPHWLEVDLQNMYQVYDIVLFGPSFGTSGHFPGYTTDYNLYVSGNGSSWNFIGTGTFIDSLDPAKYSNTWILPTPFSSVQYIKYEVIGGSHWANLYEMEVNSVPIPGAIWLLGSGLLGLLGIRRRLIR